MDSFKKFFTKRNAKRLGLLAGRKLEQASEKELDFEDYVSELFDKGLVKWAKILSSPNRIKAAEATKNIKNLLKDMGYNIVPSKRYTKRRSVAPFSYHSRYQETEDDPVEKEIGLSRADFRGIAPKANIEKYLRRLYVLSHEAGHALQYNGNDQINRDKADGEQLAMNYMARIPNVMELPNRNEIIDNLAHIYMELSAWKRAVDELVPKELHEKLFQFAKSAYASHMKAYSVGEHESAPFIQVVLNYLKSHKYTAEEEEDVKPAGSLMRVPVKLMGLSKTSQELPNNKPYGFWMDNSGNFIPVEPYSHEDTAYDILEIANQYFRDNGYQEIDTHHINMNDILYRNGWLRLVFEGPTLHVSNNYKTPISPSQKARLIDIKEKYGASKIKHGLRYIDEDEEEPRKKGSIMRVPVREMGMSKTPEELPTPRPYGFWMDTSGNYIPVGYQNHFYVGDDVLEKANNYLKQNGYEELFIEEIYSALFNMGWLRLMFDGDKLYIENPKTKGNVSPGQKRMLLNMARRYGVRVKNENTKMSFEDEETEPKKEGSLMSVPIKLMGMSRPTEELPTPRPYGFWVDTSGNYIPVGHEEHIQVGHDMLTAANEYLKSQGKGEIDYDDIYKALQSRGWVRILFERMMGKLIMWVDFNDATREPTRHQKALMEQMVSEYRVNRVDRDDKFFMPPGKL